MEGTEKRTASTPYALFALAGVLVIVLGGNLLLDAPIHGMFFLVWLFIFPVCMHLGYSYKEINEAMMESCKQGLGTVLLLLAVGGVISTWISCGAVPAIIYYGLSIIQPHIFLLTAFLLCVMVSLPAAPPGAPPAPPESPCSPSARALAFLPE